MSEGKLSSGESFTESGCVLLPAQAKSTGSIECMYSRDKWPYLFDKTKKVFALQKSSTPSELI